MDLMTWGGLGLRLYRSCMNYF